MSPLEDFLKLHKREIQECYFQGIDWLIHSGIRDSEGGYKSEYNPHNRAYSVWGGGNNCILNTAGAVLTLLDVPEFHAQAMQSARYLQKNIVKSPAFFSGSLPAGDQSEVIFPNYMGWVILALCKAFSQTKDDTLLESATALANWLVNRAQTADGRIYDSFRLKGGGILPSLKAATGMSYSTWHAVLIWALSDLARLQGDENLYAGFNTNLLAWLKGAQTTEGSMKSQLWGRGSVIYQAFIHGRIGLLIDNWDKAMHPTSAVLCLQAFRLLNERERELRLTKWLMRAIGDRGLFFQFYWNDHHSVEEDVMPTALFAELLLGYEIPEGENITSRTISAILRSQIHSDDLNANGGIRGLPLHPTLGESAFSWDTQFSLMLIRSTLKPIGLLPS